MEITTLQIVLVFIVACIAGMESVLDEFQFHRPLVACTLIGAVLGDMKTGIIIGGTGNDRPRLDEHRCGSCARCRAGVHYFDRSGYRRSSEYWCRYRAGHPAGRSGSGADHYRPYYYRGLPARGG